MVIADLGLAAADTCEDVCFHRVRLALRRRWSLNWDQINSQIVVGSCPRSASDIDRMVDEAGISAIICLQVRHLLGGCLNPSYDCKYLL